MRNVTIVVPVFMTSCQFEAFKKLSEERGLGAEEIAARFGVTPHVVRQRLRLGAVSPKLMDIYRSGDLALDQLMAFAITEDHARRRRLLPCQCQRLWLIFRHGG